MQEVTTYRPIQFLQPVSIPASMTVRQKPLPLNYYFRSHTLIPLSKSVCNPLPLPEGKALQTKCQNCSCES